MLLPRRVVPLPREARRQVHPQAPEMRCTVELGFVGSDIVAIQAILSCHLLFANGNAKSATFETA